MAPSGPIGVRDLLTGIVFAVRAAKAARLASSAASSAFFEGSRALSIVAASLESESWRRC